MLERPMKPLLILPLLFLFLIPYAQATTYQSRYGFTVDVPDRWLVVTQASIAAAPEQFQAHTAESPYGVIDRALLRTVVSRVQTGKVEIYLKQSTTDPTAADHIQVTQRSGTLPTDTGDVRKACKGLESYFSKQFGRTIVVYNCGVDRIRGRPALQLEFDGVQRGTRSMQYRIQGTATTTVLITATSNTATLDQVRPDFRRIVNSIHF